LRKATEEYLSRIIRTYYRELEYRITQIIKERIVSASVRYGKLSTPEIIVSSKYSYDKVILPRDIRFSHTHVYSVLVVPFENRTIRGYIPYISNIKIGKHSAALFATPSRYIVTYYGKVYAELPSNMTLERFKQLLQYSRPFIDRHIDYAIRSPTIRRGTVLPSQFYLFDPVEDRFYVARVEPVEYADESLNKLLSFYLYVEAVRSAKIVVEPIDIDDSLLKEYVEYNISVPERLGEAFGLRLRERAEYYTRSELEFLRRFFGDKTPVKEYFDLKQVIYVNGMRGTGKTFSTMMAVMDKPVLYILYDKSRGQILVRNPRFFYRRNDAVFNKVMRAYRSRSLDEFIDMLDKLPEGTTVVLDDVHYMYDAGLYRTLHRLIDKVLELEHLSRIVITDYPLENYMLKLGMRRKAYRFVTGSVSLHLDNEILNSDILVFMKLLGIPVSLAKLLYYVRAHTYRELVRLLNTTCTTAIDSILYNIGYTEKL